MVLPVVDGTPALTQVPHCFMVLTTYLPIGILIYCIYFGNFSSLRKPGKDRNDKENKFLCMVPPKFPYHLPSTF